MRTNVPSFSRIEAAFFSKMGEELSSSDIFHEYLQVLGVLTDALETDLNKSIFTIMG